MRKPTREEIAASIKKAKLHHCDEPTALGMQTMFDSLIMIYRTTNNNDQKRKLAVTLVGLMTVFVEWGGSVAFIDPPENDH